MTRRNPLTFSAFSLPPVSMTVGGIDHREVIALRTELKSRFAEMASDAGIAVRGGRSNNVPTLVDALHFMLLHVYFSDATFDSYVESLVERASL